MRKLKVIGTYSKTVDEYLRNPFRVKVVFELVRPTDELELSRYVKAQVKFAYDYDPLSVLYVGYGPTDLAYLHDRFAPKDYVYSFSPACMFEPIRFLARRSVSKWLEVHIVPDVAYEKVAEHSWTDEALGLSLQAQAEYWQNPRTGFIVYTLHMRYKNEPVIVMDGGTPIFIGKATCPYGGKIMLFWQNPSFDEDTAKEALYKFLSRWTTTLASEHYVTQPVGYITAQGHLASVATRFRPIVSQ